MDAFNPSKYGLTLAALMGQERLAELGPGQPNPAVRPQLAALSMGTAFTPHEVRDRQMAAACLAGMWLYHDFLDESHSISQTIDTPAGSYWHGIMHRREPDAENAKYWFRRVGRHPVFEPLGKMVREMEAPAGLYRPLAKDGWDPFAFVDLCEAWREEKGANEMFCRRVQQREWELLFDYCYRRAVE